MTRYLPFAMATCAMMFTFMQISAEERNSLTEDEKNAGWRLLFDGRSTSGWRGYKSDKMPESWRVENGSLFSRREQGKSVGDIVTEDLFDDFELRVDWKMKPGHNSGIIYRVVDLMG